MSTRIRVLFVEDSQDDMLLQLRELEREGFDVEYQCVQRVEELRAALLSGSWDIILSDYSLPSFTGIDALRVVQELGKDVPFILISGTIGEEIAVESMKAGAADYLLKVNLTRLVPAVRRELREAEHRRQRRQAVEQQQRLEAQLTQAQKLEAIGTLASSIAHDFNNILAGIAGYVEIVRADTLGMPHVQDNVELILQGIHRATELIRRILQYSRKRPVQRKPMHLGPVVHEALQFLRPLIRSNVQLQSRLTTEGPLVDADAGQMQQIVVNLCTNALQAMSERGGKLTVELDAINADGTLVERLPELNPTRYVRLIVADTGSGMDEETMSQLFEPFFTTKPVGVGTGLGMAVVKGLVSSHRGVIEVSSEVGKGTTFTLYFPIHDEREDDEPVGLPGKGERLLFVDDESYLVDMGIALLTRLGYRVIGFVDPLKALAYFQERPDDVDALITDLTMPGMKGTDLACRVQEIRPRIPVILVTGYSGPLELDRARSLGFTHVLEKPYTMDKIVEILRQLLRRRSDPNCDQRTS